MGFQDNKASQSRPTRRLVGMAMLIAISLVLSYFERFIPINVILPGVKLGLANVVTLVALYFLGLPEVFLMVVIRVVMMSFFGGNMISFFYSLTGGVLSLMTMSFAVKRLGNIYSIVGVSVLGAVSHNTGQVIVLGILMESVNVPLGWYPYLLFVGLATGVVTGYIGKYFCEHYKKLSINFG